MNFGTDPPAGEGEEGLLPGLCLFTAEWLSKVAAPQFRDTVQVSWEGLGVNGIDNGNGAGTLIRKVKVELMPGGSVTGQVATMHFAHWA